jgi:hypothetical protein
MRIARHTYSDDLARAAERFMIDQFDSPTQFTEASHLPDLVDAAMHIITGAAWIQTDGARRYPADAAYDERGSEEDEGEEEEDEP